MRNKDGNKNVNHSFCADFRIHPATTSISSPDIGFVPVLWRGAARHLQMNCNNREVSEGDGARDT